jgi:hypothetical protein
MPRPKGLPKTGGRKKGVLSRPRPITLAPTDENRALALMAPTAAVRTPKAVMLSAMLHFEELATGLITQAKQKLETDPGLAADLGTQAHKFMIAAVQCAEKCAPYIHARLIAVESRSEDAPAPFVIRAPAVMLDSSAWQTAVGAAVIDMEASAGAGEGLPASGASEPAPQTSQSVPAPVVLTADPRTNRITAMPPGPRVVHPAGSQEWLASVKKVG